MEPEYFSRTEILIGKAGVKNLARAHVAVFGLGGVGSYAVECLARGGIGQLTLVDFAVVKPSNLNRQIIALHSTLEQPKTEVARMRILDINPDCLITVHRQFAASENYETFLNPKPDVVIDAVDSLTPKVNLLQTVAALKIPVISSMGAGQRLEPGMVRIGDLSKTRVCPLARILRKRLGRLGIHSGICCVYSVEPPHRDHRQDDPALLEQNNSLQRGRKREVLGSISYLPAIFGCTAAGEAIRLLLDKS